MPSTYDVHDDNHAATKSLDGCGARGDGAGGKTCYNKMNDDLPYEGYLIKIYAKVQHKRCH